MHGAVHLGDPTEVENDDRMVCIQPAFLCQNDRRQKQGATSDNGRLDLGLEDALYLQHPSRFDS
jgi:hypothetical protein